MNVLEKSEKPVPAAAQKNSMHRVEVRLKPEFADSMGSRALTLLRESGLTGVRALRTSRVYEITGPFNLGQLQQAARELLCDNVTEEFAVTGHAPASNGSSAWRVEVRLKPSVTDAVGESVGLALRDMGLPEPASVRCASVYHLAGKCARGLLEKAATRCLANPVVHVLSMTEDHG